MTAVAKGWKLDTKGMIAGLHSELNSKKEREMN
jgi:hypothetical protein